MAAGTGFEDGTQLPEGAGGAAFSSSYDEQPRSQVISRDSSTTSEEVMSNLDEDSSDFHSVHSRPESAEPVVNEVEPVPNGTGGVEWGGEGRSSTAVANAQNGAESIRHKRNLSEEEGAGQGQGQLLRKACDLCTKRKRKCNGQHPCSQCIETGVRNQCIYSPRLKSGRKKKVRIDGVLYEEGAAGLALVANNGGGGSGGGRRSAGGYALDASAGRFSASGAVGLAGHVENFFLATYLRDFNRIVPLTSESSVTEGMLEVLSPAVSSRGLSAASPIKQPESRRQAKLAVFWGVVAMGSRILGATEESTARYLGLMRTALRECFDCNDKEVVQAYLLLSTIETMRGNEEAGKRYLDHAHTMHNGNAMGPEGKLLADRPEQDECLDLVFQIYGQPDGCVGQFSSASVGGGTVRRGFAAREKNNRGGGMSGGSSSAVDEMIAQAMSPPSDSQSGPLKALKYLSTACGLSSEVFDPTNKCVTVKQYLGEMDTALKGANSLFKHTDLSECITGVVMVKIWGGVTVLMRSWGKPKDKEVGLAQVEEGVGYALTRPGLMTFPMWWHALHCAAVVLAHFGHSDTYMRLRATFNKNTFPGTEMPPIETYSPGSICPQLAGSCSKLAYWLQVRGTMCSEPDWKPKFNGKLSDASENAAYAAALDRNNVCDHQRKDNEEYTNGLNTTQNMTNVVNLVGSGGGGSSVSSVSNGVPLPSNSPGEHSLRAALDAGLSEIGCQLSDLGGMDALSSTADLDLGPLGVEFDLSQIQEADNVVGVETSTAPAAVGVPPETNYFMSVPANLTAMRSGEAVMISGGGMLSRDPSFGISGHAAASTVMSSSPFGGTSGGEALSRQSSLDLNTLMQMVSSDEELRMNEGGAPDAMDNALAFGEGPAKELFGVELSTS